MVAAGRPSRKSNFIKYFQLITSISAGSAGTRRRQMEGSRTLPLPFPRTLLRRPSLARDLPVERRQQLRPQLRVRHVDMGRVPRQPLRRLPPFSPLPCFRLCAAALSSRLSLRGTRGGPLPLTTSPVTCCRPPRR
jgi:hypothetical protein